jgi:hypothetical protein
MELTWLKWALVLDLFVLLGLLLVLGIRNYRRLSSALMPLMGLAVMLLLTGVALLREM